MPAMNGLPEKVADGGEVGHLNGYLKGQREKIGKIFSGESDGKAKIVLSGPSNSWVRFDFEFVIMGHNIAYSEQKGLGFIGWIKNLVEKKKL